MPQRAEVVLGDEERETLERWARRPKSSQALAFRCRIVLEAAEGRSSTEIAADLGCTGSTVGRWRGRFPRCNPMDAERLGHIAPTVICGLSDVYGSWKTIWMRRRRLPSSLRRSEEISVPSKTIEPPSGSTSRVRQRASGARGC
jgi:hypothetical protein